GGTRSDAEQVVEVDLQEEVAHEENNEDDGKQDDHSSEDERETGMAHLFDEGGPGIDPDPRKEQGKSEIAEHLIGRGRQVPADGSGAAEPAQDERDDERASGKAE